MINIFTDGGSRGNPGIAGVGVVLKTDNETKKFSQFLGDNITNNESEYQALIFALRKTKQLLGKKKSKQTTLNCYADSELMVRQLNHQYKLSNENIQKLFIQIWNLMLDFKEVTIIHIPREKNKEADEMANKAMDQGTIENSNKLF